MNKGHLRDLFTFTKSERSGIVVLLLLIIGLAILPHFIRPQYPDIDASLLRKFEVNLAMVDSLNKAQYNKKEDYTAFNYYEKNKVKYDNFDPNTADFKALMRCGIPYETVRNIMQFKYKGGVFKNTEDLGQIEGITPQLLKKLSPYVSIDPNYVNPNSARKKSATDSSTYKTYKPKPKLIVELNTSDSIALENLPGIGPAFANRIIKYRNRLGGFIKTEQLLEVYGVDTALYNRILPQIQLNNKEIIPLNINQITMQWENIPTLVIKMPD